VLVVIIGVVAFLCAHEEENMSAKIT